MHSKPISIRGRELAKLSERRTQRHWRQTIVKKDEKQRRIERCTEVGYGR